MDALVVYRIRCKPTGDYLWRGPKTMWSTSGAAKNAWCNEPRHVTGGQRFNEQDDYECVAFKLVEIEK